MVRPQTWVSKIQGAHLFMALLIGALGFYVVYPLFLILLNSFNEVTIYEVPVYGLKTWRDALGDYGIMESLWNTVKLAVVLQSIALPTAVFIAFLLARTNVPFSKGFEFLFWVSFLLPTISTAFAWILLLDPDTGLINTTLRKLPFLEGFSFSIYGFWGILWVHLVSHMVSTKVMLLTPAFRSMDASMEEASRMSGAGGIRTILRVTLPVMTPAIVVVFLLGAIRMFSSFEIELLLGLPADFYVFSTQIVMLAQEEPPLTNQAAVLGTLILVFLSFFIFFQRKLIGSRQYTTVTGRMKPKVIDLGPWKHVATAFIVAVVLLLVAIPLVSVFVGSFMMRFGFFDLPQVWTLTYWREAVADLRLMLAFKNTLIIAGSAALIGPFLFSLVAYILVRTRLPGRAILDSICWIPSAIPGVLAGLGLLWLFLGSPFFRPLYGTIFLLVIAAMMGGITIATQVLKANFIQLGQELEEASRMSGAGFWGTYFKIVLPLMAPAMIVIAVLKFTFAAQHASSLILLSTSETQPLVLLALDQIEAGKQEEAAITAILIILMTLGVALTARFCGLNVGLRTT